jgi:uncharacterized membrane protein
MKTNIFSTLCLAAILTSVSLVSCDENSDTTKPVINLIEPVEGDALEIGADVHFEMDLSDNEMLRSYKVEIHHNFDGHSHEATRAEEEETVPFYFENSWDVSGQKNAHIHHHEILIPANATPGDYHLEVFCTDAAGNEAFVVLNIELDYEGSEHEHEHDH